jgi:lysophospholipase L1-like esterase
MQPRRSRPGKGIACALVLVFAVCVSAHAQVAPSASDHLHLKHISRMLAAHEPLRIIAFGSSSTEGVGASVPRAAYPSQLQTVLTTALGAREPVDVLNRGIGGEDADDMVRRLPRVIAEHPDLIIWQTGSNDPLRNVPIDRFVQDTIAGIQKIRAAHIDVMLMGPQLCRRLDGTATTTLYRDALTAIGEGMDVPLIRRHMMMQAWLDQHVLTEQQMLSPDGLHMADAGYAKLAQAVSQDILRRAQPALLAMDAPAH